MVHLCVHLPEQALLGGPVSQRWMFGVERRMGTYKGYVRNFAHPDGSISEAYIVDEAIIFLSRYLHNTETRFTRLERNWDVATTKYSMELFNNNIRTLGAPTFGLLGDYHNVVQWYLLNNCGDDVDIYINEHKEILCSRNIREEDYDAVQRNEFPTWFKKKMAILKVNNDLGVTDDLYTLSQFSDDRYKSRSSCVVNGERDDKFKTQCSGVCTWGGGENDDIMYYGVILEILELDLIFQRKVFLFRCKWYNTDPKKKKMLVDNNLTSIDVTSEWYADEPFILATQAQQVFYLNDMYRGKNWMVVQKVNHRNIFDIVEHDDEETMTNDVFQVYDSNELPPFNPTDDVVETSLLVREDIDPVTVPHEVVIKLRTEESNLNDPEMEDIEDYDDDGRHLRCEGITKLVGPSTVLHSDRVFEPNMIIKEVYEVATRPVMAAMEGINVDGTSLCLQCDMIIHVGGKRTHRRYLLLRQRVEDYGWDKPGSVSTDEPGSQRLSLVKANKEPHLSTLRGNENPLNHHVSTYRTLSNNVENDGKMENMFSDLNSKPQRMRGQAPTNQVFIFNENIWNMVMHWSATIMNLMASPPSFLNVYMCNKLASRHVRVRLTEPSKVPRCDICENAPGIDVILLMLHSVENTAVWRKLYVPRGSGAGLEEIPGCGKALCRYYGGSV
ncbi:B-box type zinc finger family protein [Perilla frutescens var. hirtella]|nr:B-box type zinc finger family protein [Perilla frutescens var. hirtella]